MNVKEMREYLKDKVATVPRSNKDVELLYRKMNGLEVQEMVQDVPREAIEPKAVSTGEEWTYVGWGDTPPHMIKFMGIQNFIRGTPVKVTDPRVLEKIKDNRSFVKGAVDMDKIFEQDELAAKKAQKQREEDQKIQIMVERENRKAG